MEIYPSTIGINYVVNNAVSGGQFFDHKGMFLLNLHFHIMSIRLGQLVWYEEGISIIRLHGQYLSFPDRGRCFSPSC